MKSTYVNFRATLDLEVIQKDNKPVKLVTVATVTSPSNLNLEELEAINAV
jgi:hypothetical protein